MKNNELKNYNFKESTDFVGMVPKITERIGGIGKDLVSPDFQSLISKSDKDAEFIGLMPNIIEEIGGEGNDLMTPDFESLYYETPDFTQGGDVVLKSNYKLESPIVLEKDTVIKLNGKKITAPIFTESNGEVIEGDSDSYGIWVKNGNVTIEGKGEVIAQDAQYSMAVWANGGTVTIKGGVFHNGGDSCDLIYASAGGKVIIEGGEFFPAGPATGTVPGTKNPYTALNVKDADYKSGKSSIVVKGGIFHNFNPAENVSEVWPEGHSSGFVAEGFKSVEVKPNVWEVIPE